MSKICITKSTDTALYFASFFLFTDTCTKKGKEKIQLLLILDINISLVVELIDNESYNIEKDSKTVINKDINIIQL